MQIGGRSTQFLVDTGATFSVVRDPEGLPLVRSLTTPIVGVGGKIDQARVTRPTLVAPGIKHSFLVLPQCPLNLLGRDLLCKLQATIHCSPEGLHISFPPSLSHICYNGPPEVSETPAAWADVDRDVWYTGKPGCAVYATPHRVPLKPTALPISIKQYPIKQEARLGLLDTINNFLKEGLLVPVSSPWCTPIFPVPKPDGSWRFVQDLREVNSRVQLLHPIVANPHTLLTTLTGSQTWYTVIDLKDAFFCIPVAPESQPVFAFEWEDPVSHVRTHLSWSRLPQGYNNSPSVFAQALASDLRSFHAPGATLLQYVDDLLLVHSCKETLEKQSVDLLNFLASCGYKVSQKKIQWVTQEVTYLGYILRKGTRLIHPSRIQALNDLNPPKNVKELRSFLGISGYGRLWVPNFSVLAKPLHELTSQATAWEWTRVHQKSWEGIRSALAQATALALPDQSLPFDLFVHERASIALGVLTQSVGRERLPVAYLSKTLEPTTQGWPACLRAIAATALLVSEATKVSAGAHLRVHSPHSVSTLLEQKLPAWATSARLARYVSLLIDNDSISLHRSTCLNPATLLPTPADHPTHDCLEVLAQVVGIRPDLSANPLEEPDLSLWTDGSSFIRDGARYTGLAVVNEQGPVLQKALPAHRSAQAAELEALIAAATLAEGQRVNIYTDSRYTFLAAHTHASLWKARGFRGADGKVLKMAPLLERLMTALLLPKEVAVIHCPGHQVDEGFVSRGNRLADRCAKEAACLKRGRRTNCAL